INGHHLQIVAVTMLVQRTQHAAADAAKTIDGNAGGHEQHSGRNKGRILAYSAAGRKGQRRQVATSTLCSAVMAGTLLRLWQAVAVSIIRTAPYVCCNPALLAVGTGLSAHRFRYPPHLAGAAPLRAGRR